MSVTRMVPSARNAASSPKIGTSWIGSVLCASRLRCLVVIADGVGGADVSHPSGLKQRDEPRQVLAGDGDRPGDGEREAGVRADGAVKNRIDAAQIGAAEGG